MKKFNELTGEEKQFIYKKRGELAAKDGIELTPTQFVDTLADIQRKAEEAGIDIVDVMDYIRLMDGTPPPPPYPGMFDSLDEAEDFKGRAEAAYEGVKLAVRKEGRLFKVVEVE